MPQIKTELLDMAQEAGGPGHGVAVNTGPGVRARPEPAESEARFGALIASSPAAILVIDPDATVRLWNAAAEKLFGWTEAEVIGKAVPFIPDGRLSECTSCRDTGLRGETYSIETQRLRRDGSLVDVSLSAAPLRDKRGEVKEILVVLNDATERRRAELLLEAERRVLELIANGAPLPQVLDALVREVEANSNEGMLFSVLLADDSRERLLHGAAPTLPETYNQAIHGIRIGPSVGSCGTAAYERRPVFVCNIASDPRWADFKDLAARHGLAACCSTPLLSSQGELLGTLAVYYTQPHDPGAHERQLIERATRLAAIVIERERAEKALAAREREFRALADNMSQFAWMTDATGWIYWYNQRWFDYTGTTLQEMEGWGWQKVHHPDHVDRVVRKIRHSFDTGEPWEDTFPLRSKEGEYRWFLSRALPIRDEHGCIQHWFGTNTDITERLKAEQQRTLLINELNHRVKNTLAIVQAIAAQTLRSANVDPSVQETFESRLVALSNAHNILTRESWEAAEIHDIMARTLEPHAGPERLSVHGPSIRLAPKAALAIAMGMHELVTNAVKYGALSNGTGQVAVTWSVDEPKPGMFHLQWKERGGPAVEPPSRKGFGSRLIERNLVHDLNGKATIDYQPEGIVCTITGILRTAPGEMDAI